MDASSAFDFDAPLYADVTDSTSPGEHGDTSYFVSRGSSSSYQEKNMAQLTRKSKTPRHKRQKTPVAAQKASADNACPSTSSDVEQETVESPVVRQSPRLAAENIQQNAKVATEGVRQSPRLAAIAKSIMMTKNSKSARGPAHRRSLSAGAAIPNQIMRIKKPLMSVRSSRTVKGVALNIDDAEHLEAIATVTKELSRSLKRTKPKEFQFATDARLRSTSNCNQEYKSTNFVRSLRSANSASVASMEPSKGPTKVKAFNLHEPKHPKVPQQPFMSMAELNLKFVSKTPQRFHTKRLGAENMSYCAQDPKKGRSEAGVTVAHTPQLKTRSRARPAPQYPTIDEIEQQEFEEAQKLQFKAHPLNKKIFAKPKLESKEKVVTIPEPFNITDAKIDAEAAFKKKLVDACRNFVDSTSTLSSIPHGGIAAIWQKKSTHVKPFSFDDRDMEMLKMKKEKIEKLLEEERKKAEFHAQAMPTFEDGVKGVPEKKLPSPTKIKPFNLRSEVRRMTRQEQLQKELEELEKLEAEQRKFKAQSDAVLHKEPFIPHKSKKPLTDISGFTLNTEKRSEERLEYELHLKEKEDEIMMKKREEEARIRAEEDAEVARQRKEAVHTAQPIRKYKPVEIKTGLLPPTHPVSPEFAIETRLRARAVSQQNLNNITFAYSMSNISNSTYSADN